MQVVGSDVIGAMFRSSDKDFRANVTIGGEMRPYEPDDDEVWLAKQAAHAVGADFAGVDLLFGDEGMLVCEVNSNAHFKSLLTATGINTADEIINHIIRCCYRRQ